jgi:hypothetical protein
MGAKLFMAFADGTTSIQHEDSIEKVIRALGKEYVNRRDKPYNNSPVITATITFIDEVTDER